MILYLQCWQVSGRNTWKRRGQVASPPIVETGSLHPALSAFRFTRCEVSSWFEVMELCCCTTWPRLRFFEHFGRHRWHRDHDCTCWNVYVSLKENISFDDITESPLSFPQKTLTRSQWRSFDSHWSWFRYHRGRRKWGIWFFGCTEGWLGWF